jgi:hypothetical protein
MGDELEGIFGHMAFGITIPGGLTYMHKGRLKFGYLYG